MDAIVASGHARAEAVLTALLLAAIGLAVTFGVMGVINMAHGAWPDGDAGSLHHLRRSDLDASAAVRA